MPISRRTPTVLLFLFYAALVFAQQADTLLLHPEQLAERDIHDPQSSDKQPIKIVSGSRFPIHAADLPYSIYVITKEEIRRNGYETLVDALKMVPGIRVSQPGSANDGETFLIRGLLGNTYAKILVNDVPIKPSFLVSMPIGAQLPVKEAERIEVIYGTGASLYGSDAPAGIINIITRESEKPVFMQADLSAGGTGFRSVNVMFGGRLGRDKRILKYFAYGSSMLMEDRKIFKDYKYNLNLSTYDLDKIYATLPNYSGIESFPILNPTPHQSRRFGFIAKYKRFTLSLESMYRRDHSSLGFNPAAYSYGNSLTYTGESISRINLNLFKEKENKNRKTDFTVNLYNTDSRSSTLPAWNRLSQLMMNASEAKAKRLGNDSTLHYFNSLYDEYLSGPRYLVGLSYDVRVEHVRNYRLLRHITLTAGLNARLSFGTARTGLFPTAVDESFNVSNSYSSELYHNKFYNTLSDVFIGYPDFNAFGQLFYNGKKIKVSAGLNFSSTYVELNGGYDALSPTIAAVWNITDFLNVRTSLGKAFRTPNPFYYSNSYAVISPSNSTLYNPSNPDINAEQTVSWETGARFKTKDGRVGAELTWFLNRTSRLIQFRTIEQYFDADSTDYLAEIGYTNLDNSFLHYRGGNATIFFNMKFDPKRVMNIQLNYSWLGASYGVDGQSSYEGLNPPFGNMIQLRNVFSLSQKNTLVLDFIRYSRLSRAYSPRQQSRFWTCDLVYRYSFTDRFDAYIKVVNLFNRSYSGIPPDGDVRELLHYNPQSGRFVRVGMNYYIE